MSFVARLILVSLTLLAGAAETLAASRDGAIMRTIGPTSQPVGHYEFCRRLPAECDPRGERRGRVQLTAAKWQQLIAINDNVNTAVDPGTDKEIFGVEEYWSFPEGRGDCEDYVLLKRRELIRLGWPAGALLITVVRQSNGDGHAVLTVLTDRGDLVLDNLVGTIEVWNQTSYQYVKRQSDRDPGRWVSIEDDRDLLVGSVR
ncbi:transglutaminase-like cysteine peptidase [Prosthecomicrobium pneumaticum]|uniref:Putative transglutaminase-like cysteine proteinase n=1 Tax=Prosthecomicrobium pneumaticum TaxID=81895 RepID=A0A7W9L3D1_9HYPH|nr:putative transglutaminase-like cysteine proteinase [Prosthecomicrobium pneumaticum]